MFAYQFRRVGSAGIYRRVSSFVPGLAQPVFTDGVTADVIALVTRRLDVALSGGYSQGASALVQDALHFETYRASVRLQFAVAKSAAIHAEYLYYFYDFPGMRSCRSGLLPGCNGTACGSVCACCSRIARLMTCCQAGNTLRTMFSASRYGENG